MKKLYLIPIIHMGADMGSAAPVLDEKGTTKLSPELWRKHQVIVSAFWDSIDRFLDSMHVNGFKIYQDGLVADGEEGLRIVRESASQGSKNYEIVRKLLKKGAVLVKTESISLVKQEYGYITKMTRSKSPKEREVAALRYKLARGKLLKQRDEFIAGRIDETLAESETGILFIGAYHDIVKKLASDIRVGQVKEVARVKEYHDALINKRRHDQYLQELGDYLSSPIYSTSF